MADRRNTNRRWKTVDDLHKDCFDNYAPAYTVIDVQHRMTHEGAMFDVSGYVQNIAATGGTLDLMIRRPAGVIGHFITIEFAIDDGPALIQFYENPTVSADGTAKSVINHNRVYGLDPPTSSFFEQPTVTDVGDLLHTRYIPAGGNKQGQLVEGEGTEWVIGDLDVQTQYLWRLTNNGNSAIDVGYHFNGYFIPD